MSRFLRCRILSLSLSVRARELRKVNGTWVLKLAWSCSSSRSIVEIRERVVRWRNERRNQESMGSWEVDIRALAKLKATSAA